MYYYMYGTLENEVSISIRYRMNNLIISTIKIKKKSFNTFYNQQSSFYSSVG